MRTLLQVSRLQMRVRGCCLYLSHTGKVPLGMCPENGKLPLPVYQFRDSYGDFFESRTKGKIGYCTGTANTFSWYPQRGFARSCHNRTCSGNVVSYFVTKSDFTKNL